MKVKSEAPRCLQKPSLGGRKSQFKAKTAASMREKDEFSSVKMGTPSLFTKSNSRLSQVINVSSQAKTPAKKWWTDDLMQKLPPLPEQTSSKELSDVVTHALRELARDQSFLMVRVGEELKFS